MSSLAIETFGRSFQVFIIPFVKVILVATSNIATPTTGYNAPQKSIKGPKTHPLTTVGQGAIIGAIIGGLLGFTLFKPTHGESQVREPAIRPANSYQPPNYIRNRIDNYAQKKNAYWTVKTKSELFR